MIPWMLLGLISTYKEGTTARHAIRSALEACDRLLICEGPAGPPLEGAAVPGTWMPADERAEIITGRWRSDARKRTAMLEHARSQTWWAAPVWGLWLDGDEVLVNPEYLADWTDFFDWQNETAGEEPVMRIPLRLVELDGSISMSYVKLLRVDLVRSYDLSIANLTNTLGIVEKAGNLHEHLTGWVASHPRAAEGYLYWPPGPAPLDPFIVHRSLLRHPARAGLRLHEQEAEMIAREASGSPPRPTTE
jgi:hypothetical protein